MKLSGRYLLASDYFTPKVQRVGATMIIRMGLIGLAALLDESLLKTMFIIIALIIESLVFTFCNSTDPGYFNGCKRRPCDLSLVPLSQRKADMKEGASVCDRLRPAPQNVRSYCSICYTEPPLRAQHCSVCDRCVCQFDHHYFFFGKPKIHQKLNAYVVSELNNNTIYCYRDFWITSSASRMRRRKE